MKIGIEFRYINSPSPQKLQNSSRSPPPQPILGHLGGNRANFPPLTSLKTRSGVTKDENWWKTPNPKILCFSNWFTSPNRLETLITSPGTVLKTCFFKIWDVSCSSTKFRKLLVLLWIKLSTVEGNLANYFNTNVTSSNIYKEKSRSKHVHIREAVKKGIF